VNPPIQQDCRYHTELRLLDAHSFRVCCCLLPPAAAAGGITAVAVALVWLVSFTVGGCRCGRAPDDISSIVLVEENSHHIKSDAILRIASGLAVPFPLVAAALLPMPHFVRDTFYDQVCVTYV
jgi:hypothetical protein